MIYVDIFEKAYQFLQDEGIAARRHIELKQYTTLHIGGEAQILAEPSSITQIQQCLAVCKQHRIEWFLLGNGSNVLAMDEGFQGMVIVWQRILTASDWRRKIVCVHKAGQPSRR